MVHLLYVEAQFHLETNNNAYFVLESHIRSFTAIKPHLNFGVALERCNMMRSANIVHNTLYFHY